MYEILLERHAERDLRNLPLAVGPRVLAALRKLRFNPRPPGCKKLAGARNDWRVRVGDYRLVYEIDDRAKVVRVMFIRHRRDAYR